MNYDLFKFKFLENLHREFPDAVSIEIKKILKNNSISLDAVIIVDRYSNISPSLYLNNYYSLIEDNVEFQDIFDLFVKTYRKAAFEGSIDIEFFTDFNRAKKNIAFKLINFRKNAEFLEDVPYRNFLDLAVVPFCVTPPDMHMGDGYIVIHRSHLSLWDISEDELFEHAIKNTPRLYPYVHMTMDEYHSHLMRKMECIRETFDDDIFPLDPADMHIITNDQVTYGSSCMMYPGLLKKLSEEIGSGFYVVPSSVHEIMLIPSPDSTHIYHLSKMIREVNRHMVAEQDILSNNAYYYNKELDKISL